MTTLASHAPASGDLLGEVATTPVSHIAQMVARAKRAQEAWGALSVDERIERVSALLSLIGQRSEDIAATISRENGKPKHEALIHEIFTLCEIGHFYAANAPRVLEARSFFPRVLKHRSSTVRRVPLGVVAILSPWNFPFMIPGADLLAALIAGNAVILKPSEFTPLTATLLKELFDESGLPEDLFQVVYGHAAEGAALVAAGVQKVIFTGGTGGGKKVAALAGEHLVPCVLELGGKAPAIVCEDANIALAAKAIVYGAFANLGQACVSIERVYAHSSIYDRLVQRIADETRTLTQGDPATGTFDLGAACIDSVRTRIEEQVADALSKGARLIVSSTPSGPRFLSPSVLIHCNETMSVMREESFGPIVGIQKVESDDEAIRLSNGLPVGLSANVFSGDKRRARSIAERLRAGSIAINDALVNYGTVEAPFGGVGASGYGRVHGEESLVAMTSTQHISEERLPLGSRNPLWFPYAEWKTTLAQKALGVLFSKK